MGEAGVDDDDIETQLDALSQLEELKKEKVDVLAQRASNSVASAQVTRKAHEANKKNLKSDLKKTTAFVKKIRSINTEGLQQCIRDVETLNLTLYISEIVGAIVETAYKATDVPSMVKLCISLHKRYEEFTAPLLNGLKTSLFAIPSEEDKDAGKRKRIQIRFMVELFQVGICVEEGFFSDLLRALVGKAKGGSGKQPIDLLGLATFVKYGSEALLGFASRRMHQLARQAQLPLSELPGQHTLSTQSINTYYQHILSTHLINTPFTRQSSFKLPINTPLQSLATHPINPSSQRTFSTLPHSTSYQPTHSSPYTTPTQPTLPLYTPQ